MIRFSMTLWEILDMIKDNLWVYGSVLHIYIYVYIYIGWCIQWIQMLEGFEYDHMIIEYIVCTL